MSGGWQLPIPFDGYEIEVRQQDLRGSSYGDTHIYRGYDYGGGIFQTPYGFPQDHSHVVLDRSGFPKYDRAMGGNITRYDK